MVCGLTWFCFWFVFGLGPYPFGQLPMQGLSMAANISPMVYMEVRPQDETSSVTPVPAPVPEFDDFLSCHSRHLPHPQRPEASAPTPTAAAASAASAAAASAPPTMGPAAPVLSGWMQSAGMPPQANFRFCFNREMIVIY